MTRWKWDPMITAAGRRALVRLPDGREGRLESVGRVGRTARVVVGGRRVRVPADDLELVDLDQTDTGC